MPSQKIDFPLNKNYLHNYRWQSLMSCWLLVWPSRSGSSICCRWQMRQTLLWPRLWGICLGYLMFFFKISCRGIRIFFRNSYRFGIFAFEKPVKFPKRFLNAYRFVLFSKNVPGLEVEIPKQNRFGKKYGGNFFHLLGVWFFRNVS